MEPELYETVVLTDSEKKAMADIDELYGVVKQSTDRIGALTLELELSKQHSLSINNQFNEKRNEFLQNLKDKYGEFRFNKDNDIEVKK